MAPKMIKFAAIMAFAPTVVFASDEVSEDDQQNNDDLEVDLISQEGEVIRVPKKAAKMSELAKTMPGWEKDEDNAEADDGAPDVPLPNVKTHILRKVMDFCKHYTAAAANKMNDIEKPLKSSNMGEVVQDWYAKYVEVEQEVLFELILAANYMDIKPLLDLGCATVASMIKGQTPEQIRKTFNIVNDGSEDQAQADAEAEETKE